MYLAQNNFMSRFTGKLRGFVSVLEHTAICIDLCKEVFRITCQRLSAFGFRKIKPLLQSTLIPLVKNFMEDESLVNNAADAS